ncbi:helix-turn-helix domain-containing protein [Nocardia sp. NPDC055321]
MTSSLNQAKEALGGRLRELRLDAGLTGVELARRAGWHQSKVSKIEYGKTMPADADVRAWCSITESENQLADIIATLRNIEAAYLEWRRVLALGTKRRQQASVKLESETALMRWFEPFVVPGLLQTAEYAEEILRNVIAFYGTTNDLDEGVSKRMERQQVLYRRKHRFRFVMAEQVLYTTVGDDQVMIGQLDRLLAVSTMSRVSIGIVPTGARYRVPVTNFIMFDDRQVMVENITAELTITQPREIALYEKVFETVSSQAATRDDARDLIRRALGVRMASQ